MSYFVFGFIDFTLAQDDPGREWERIQSCAAAQGFFVRLGAATDLPIITEMRGSYAPDWNLPFMLTASPNNDTSDELISPYTNGIEKSVAAVDAVGRWLACILESVTVATVRLWTTEGFDDAFEHQEMRLEEFAAELAHRFREEGDVPSLRLTIVRSTV